MGKIIKIDLTKKKIEYIKDLFNKEFHYGRGLAVRLIDKFTPKHCDKLDEENCIILVPGLFTGTLAPSTGRLIVACKEDAGQGIQYANLAGTFSQKLSSLNIDALIITGKYIDDNFAHINISESNITLTPIESTKENTVSKTIKSVRYEFGEHSSIIGIGKSGENLNPISTLFSTYPNKVPYYYCARRAMGDVFGSKKLKCISVTTQKHFSTPVENKEKFNETTKELSKIIINNPVCGGALPAFGSITLIKMMKSGKINEMLENLNKAKVSKKCSLKGEILDINRTCSPLCVVGCLNRHAKTKNEFFLSPAESEVHAALMHSLGIDDMNLASELNQRAFEYGIDSVELSFSIALLLKILEKEPSRENILGAVDEIKNNTLIGRVLGSKTTGIFNLYKNRQEFRDLVSRPSISDEKKFNVQVPNKLKSLEAIDDMEYLYANMIAFENLGFCLFTIFALLEDENALTKLKELFLYKTGKFIDKKELLQYALECLEYENRFKEVSLYKEPSKNIPEFVKVLYRYYDLKK